MPLEPVKVLLADLLDVHHCSRPETSVGWPLGKAHACACTSWLDPRSTRAQLQSGVELPLLPPCATFNKWLVHLVNPASTSMCAADQTCQAYVHVYEIIEMASIREYINASSVMAFMTLQIPGVLGLYKLPHVPQLQSGKLSNKLL